MQRTRLVKSVTVRIADWIHSVLAAHVSQMRFFHRCWSTRRLQSPISTLSRTPGHYSYTHTLARRSHRIRTRAALTLPYTRPQIAKLRLCTCAWTGGALSDVLVLDTGLPCPAGQ